MAFYNEDQLKHYFETAMNKEAQKKIDALKDEIHTIYSREMNKVKDELRLKHMLERQKALRDVNVVFQDKMNHIGIEYNAELIRARNHMVDVVFEDVKQKLMSFTKTDAYQALMTKKLLYILKTYSKHSFVFFFKAEDTMMKHVIEHNVKHPFTLQTSAAIDIGGFIVNIVEEKTEIDESFDALIKAQRLHFRQSSKLFIR